MRLPKSIAVLLCAGAALLAIPNAALAQTPGYHLVGLPSNGVRGFATALSADGRVAAGYSQGSGQVAEPGFVWSETAGRYDYGFETSSAWYSRSAALSADGSTVVGQAINTQAYRWSGPGTFQTLGFLGSYQKTAATGVSGDASIVVGRAYTDQTPFGQAWRWTQAGGMQALGYTRPGDI